LPSPLFEKSFDKLRTGTPSFEPKKSPVFWAFLVCGKMDLMDQKSKGVRKNEKIEK
jgi:hypothetical protein